MTITKFASYSGVKLVEGGGGEKSDTWWSNRVVISTFFCAWSTMYPAEPATIFADAVPSSLLSSATAQLPTFTDLLITRSKKGRAPGRGRKWGGWGYAGQGTGDKKKKAVREIADADGAFELSLFLSLVDCRSKRQPTDGRGPETRVEKISRKRLCWTDDSLAKFFFEIYLK